MIPVADTDILSMFGKVKSISTLKQLFNELYVPTAVYEELLRAKDVGLSFLDYVLDDIEVINLSKEEHHEYISLLKNEKYLHRGNFKPLSSANTEVEWFSRMIGWQRISAPKMEFRVLTSKVFSGHFS